MILQGEEFASGKPIVTDLSACPGRWCQDACTSVCLQVPETDCGMRHSHAAPKEDRIKQ